MITNFKTAPVAMSREAPVTTRKNLEPCYCKYPNLVCNKNNYLQGCAP